MKVAEKIISQIESSKQLKHTAKNWIGGDWIDTEKSGISINPATGESIGMYADSGVKEAKKAVEVAVKTFNETAWKNDHALRSKVLSAMADLIEASSQKLIQMLCTEGGKTTADASMEVFAGPACFRYWAGKTFTTGRSGEASTGTHSIIVREAVGVAGIIVPFNAPVALTIRSLAPALAAGTTAVVKLPGVTAQTNEMLSKVMSETPGLPAGVINILTESGSEVAKFLVQSPDVPVISFTGSSETGRAIAAAGAARLKRFILELGGKTPTIVFDDADTEAAIIAMEKAITLFSGQFCMAGSRILIQRAIADKVRKELAERLNSVKVGRSLDAESTMGSMIDKANVQRVNNMVKVAIASGAKVLVRGGPITEGELAKGAFYKPTLLEITDGKPSIVQQEIFGPVATLQVFDTEEEAIALANDCEYGLAASIWSRDIEKPWRVAKSVQAGTIWINTYGQVFTQFEEGGYKQSGIGRLNGEAALESFLEYKHIVFNIGKTA